MQKEGSFLKGEKKKKGGRSPTNLSLSSKIHSSPLVLRLLMAVRFAEECYTQILASNIKGRKYGRPENVLLLLTIDLLYLWQVIMIIHLYSCRMCHIWDSSEFLVVLGSMGWENDQ